MKLGYSMAAMVACGFLGWGGEPLMLSEAYSLALKNEPRLQSLVLQTEATKESIEQSKARLRPQLQGNVSWGRYEYEADYLRAPVKENYSSYSISASQPVFRPELWRGLDESKARVESTQYRLKTEAQKLGLDVAKVYFTLLKSQRNIELFKSQREYYLTKYKQLEEMLKFGLSNRIDLLDAKVHSDQALSEWLTEQKRLKAVELRLERLINQPVGDVPSFDFTAINADELFHERSDWEPKLDNYPALKASEASQEMANQQVAIRKSEHYPKVDLSVSRKETYSKDTIAHKYDNQAIIQMSIPIYQGGFTQSRIREGLLLLDSANKDVEYNRLESKSRFEELWAERELNIENLIALKESEQSAKLYLESVEKAHSAGLKSLVDVLEAKAKLYEIKRNAIDAGYELVNNYLSLLDITGELNSENIEILEKMAIKQEK